MARGIDGFGSKLLSISVLALLGASGCGKVSVTENAVPTSSSPGGSVGTVPTQPTTPTNPSTGQPTNPSTGTPTNPSTPGGGSNPGTLNPPTEAIGDPATATANGAVLTNTRTTIYNLDSAAVGEGSWQPTTLLTTNLSGGPTLDTRVAFDSAGNGFAMWVHRSIGTYVTRYLASTASWSTPVRLDSIATKPVEPRLAVDPQSGNAIATWVQSDGVALSQYMRQFDTATSTWGATQLLENTNNPVANSEATSVTMLGNQAAIVWRQSDGTYINLYMSRLVDGTWTTPVIVDTSNQPGLRAEAAIDSSGNVMIAWRQLDGEYRIHARRWNNSTQTFGSVIQLDNEGDRQPRIAFDAAGNGFVLWRGGGAYVRRYNATTNSWDPQVTLDDQTGDPRVADITSDAAGNAMAVWINLAGGDESTYVSRYDLATGTWGPPELMELSDQNANSDKNPAVSVNGEEAVIAWVQEDINGIDSVYARKLSAGVWGPVTLLETDSAHADYVFSTVNTVGNAAVVWGQGFPYEARYLSSNFVVPNGATWQSLANTLYGVNSVEGGNALQAALGGGSAPVPGTILNGLPATLSVTTSVPAYYTVLATDTWSHIAQTVYGITDVNAIAQLRTLLGNPTLTAGLQLVVPTSYNYVTSGSYSAPLDWSRVNTTTTTYHNLDASELTVPLDSWSAPELLQSGYASSATARIAFDANNNGIAVWAQGADLMMSRYVASTATWSEPVALDSNPNDAYSPRLSLDRTTGDAVVSWVQSDGTAASMYASSFDASTNGWTTPTLLEAAAGEVSAWTENSAAANAGEYAAVTWSQDNGGENNIYLSRLVGGTWTAPALIDTGADPAEQASVAVDANGNITVIWRQFSPSDGEHRINVRRWDNVAQAYGSVTAIDGDGDRNPRIAFDAQGNGFALWGGGAYVRRFNVTTGQWGSQVQLNVGDIAAWNGEISVDAAGNALAAWMDHDGTTVSTYASYYNVTTQAWSTAVPLENSADESSYDKNLTVSLVDGAGVVAWVQVTNDQADLYAARFADGVWSAATQVDASTDRIDHVAAAIDAANNATIVWIQSDWVHHAVSDATPYFLVPAGATWRSIAATLYNEDSDAAGEALRIAMGNPALSTGLHLQGMPATLAVSPQVPTHYIVQSGDTWASITLALYGTSYAEAALALQTYLQNPPLTVGSQLLIPGELNYSVPDA